MKRPITICSGQFGDLPAEELCRTMSAIGYDGLEVATQAHVDVEKIVSDGVYRAEYRAMLERYHLSIGALSGHLAGQCVGDRYDPRLDNFVPSEVKGDPEGTRAWAVERMKTIARAAQLLDVKVVTCFLGSPIMGVLVLLPADHAGDGRGRLSDH
jgi:sugar phosphate isomerase/epimerase